MKLIGQIILIILLALIILGGFYFINSFNRPPIRAATLNFKVFFQLSLLGDFIGSRINNLVFANF